MAQLVVVSDVHLGFLGDLRSALLCDALQRISSEVEYLVLNGDIFDFIFGDNAYFRKKFQAFGDILRDTARRGIKVVFIEGNHEFHLDRIGWHDIEVIKGDHYIVRLKTGESIKIGHGDLLTNDPLYRMFRGALKSDAVRLLASKVPGALLDAYALRHARFSRAQDAYRRVHHLRVLEAAEKWVAADLCNHGIFGHFHIPYSEKSGTTDGLLVSVESWDKPNLLTYEKGTFSRIYLKEPGAAFEFTPTSSVLLKK